MKSLTELGMADIASRPRGRGAWKLGWIIALLVACYVVVRNLLFIRAGMLRPDFGIIHEAYNFNLGQVGWILLVIASIFAGLAITWSSVRKQLLMIAFLYAFLGADVFALRYYVTRIEPEQLVVKHVRLETPKLSETVRLLHITDIQAGSIGEYQISIFNKIKELNPDIILNTGDFLQIVEPATFDEEWEKLLVLIASVNPRYGTFAVLGDTDWGRELSRIKLDDLYPIQMLSSRTQVVELDSGSSLSLHGLNLNQSKSAEWAIRSIDHWLEKSSPTEFRILFGHAPDYALGVSEKPIDLCLAGHTHGGQVRLPWYGPLVIDSDVPKEWSRGFRRVGIPYLNVSAGAGSNRHKGLPPLRFNCPTEMTLIELAPIRPLR
ncbi:MAG: metallophosphoesterase [Opitutaceae bacterium]